MGGSKSCRFKDRLMTETRLTQNFANFHATIISVSDVKNLVSVLNRFEVRATHLFGKAGTIPPILPLLRKDQDFLIIDCDSEAAAELSSAPPSDLAAVPVIGLLSSEAPSRLKTMMRLGATSSIRLPVHGATVFPALYLGINGHRRLQQLQADRDLLERRRRSRRHISKAILHRMHTQGISDDAAYEALRKEAMQARQSIEDHCEACVEDACSYVFTEAVRVA
jgi:AmiR/NasT family two-component response regulator